MRILRKKKTLQITPSRPTTFMAPLPPPICRPVTIKKHHPLLEYYELNPSQISTKYNGLQLISLFITKQYLKYIKRCLALERKGEYSTCLRF